jgi:hypothetical protein
VRDGRGDMHDVVPGEALILARDENNLDDKSKGK